MQVVELKTAYHWHCEVCSEENFALPKKAELTDDERERTFRHFHDMEDFEQLPDGWESFEIVEVPNTVQCIACRTSFKTVDERLP